MVDGVVGAPDVVGDLLVGLHVRAREQLRTGPLGQRRLGDDLPGPADPGGHDAQVVALGVGEVAGVDPGLVPEVPRAQAHRAAGARVGDVRGEAEGVVRGGVALPVGVQVEVDRAVVHHQVRPVGVRVHLGEDPGLPPLGGLGDHGPAGLPLEHALGVVLQVLADAGGVHEHVHADLAQVLGGSDPGEHQQLGGVDGAGGDDHLAAGAHGPGRAEGVVHHLDAGRPAVLDDHALGLGRVQDREVVPVGGRVQVGHGRGRPGAVGAAVDLEEVRAVDHGLAGVEGGARDPRLLAGLEQGDAAGVVVRDLHQVHGPVVAVVGALVVVGLELLVEPEGGLGVPALGAVDLLPLVQVLGRGPERDARVVRRAAAQHLGAGHAHVRVAVLLLLDGVVPVVAGLQQLHPPAEGQHLVDVPVVRSGLDQPDAHGRVLGQAGGDDGAGGAAADHQVVELLRGLGRWGGAGRGHVSPREGLGTFSRRGSSRGAPASSSCGRRRRRAGAGQGAANQPVTAGAVFW